MARKKLVIIGCGFGGIYTYKNLQKINTANLDITLIDKNNYFTFTPMIHEVATGGLSKELVVESIRELIDSKTTNYINESVNQINTKKNEIILNSGTKLNYDYLVLATGARANYFKNTKIKQNTLTLKTLKDAIKIKNSILNSFEQATYKKTNNKNYLDLLSFVVVGAGATGVELAAEIAEYVYEDCLNSYPKIEKGDISVTLISAQKNLIDDYSKKSQSYALEVLNNLKVDIKFNCEVTDVDKTQIKTNTNDVIKTKNVFWVAGVKPTFPNLDIQQNNERLEINQNLILNNTSNVFALGDVAGDYEMLAQTATLQAKVVARNINNLLNNRALISYKHNLKGKLLSLGSKTALGEMLGFNLQGRYVWFIWRTVYLTKIVSFKNKLRVALNWLLNLFYPRDITKVEYEN